ncbi:hypothetical protein HFO28_25335 [Rhizobium leguminosarum]|uniref:hypothetical protein n=1 Tax=Rhizobium leguminosarum TaxID=384 RepID=UPI001C97360A|nr:hypothetical protein [Rhizobium leguminosarum]MBY5746878.1 hypothetical protein [Rhizobium leguminosarum]
MTTSVHPRHGSINKRYTTKAWLAKGRDIERSAPDDNHLCIDCWIGEKHVTLLIASVAPFVAKDFTFSNAGAMFAKITA